jgi:lysozyme
VTGDCHTTYLWFSKLSAPRRAVIVSMAFNLGVKGVGGFWKMTGAIDCGDFATAAAEMRSSLWAKQVGRRAIELSLMMEKNDFVTEQEIDQWIKNNAA